jgi:transcriptional regulator GlxA family with amidase domain
MSIALDVLSVPASTAGALAVIRYAKIHSTGHRAWLTALLAAPASVRRAERFLEEHVADAVGLTDVARAAAVSARALQMAFRRHRDTTPMAHLRALRLEQARRALAETGRDGGLVTTVALLLGFGSLSRFAAD